MTDDGKANWDVTLKMTKRDGSHAWTSTFVVEAAFSSDAVALAMMDCASRTVSLRSMELVGEPTRRR